MADSDQGIAARAHTVGVMWREEKRGRPVEAISGRILRRPGANGAGDAGPDVNSLQHAVLSLGVNGVRVGRINLAAEAVHTEDTNPIPPTDSFAPLRVTR